VNDPSADAIIEWMARRRFVVERPLEVFGERGGSRKINPYGELWGEVPLGKDNVVVYLDNVAFWCHRDAFDAAARPYSPDPL
jgi:hypothetical protein